MITFKDVIETNKQLNKTQALVDRITKADSAYSHESELNRTLMVKLNKLIGKYFTEKKKAHAHTYVDASGIKEATLQISKVGIGKTHIYYSQINTFDNIVANPNGKGYRQNGFIDTVVDDDKIFDECISHMSENGKYIFNSVKETYSKYKITDPDDSKVTTPIKATPEEAVMLGQSKLFIHITDDRNLSLSISTNSNIEQYHNRDIFTLNSLKLDNPEDFIYNMFINNHATEIETALNNYQKLTDEKLKTWKDFNEALKEKLSKFLVLMEI